MKERRVVASDGVARGLAPRGRAVADQLVCAMREGKTWDELLDMARDLVPNLWSRPIDFAETTVMMMLVMVGVTEEELDRLGIRSAEN